MYKFFQTGFSPSFFSPTQRQSSYSHLVKSEFCFFFVEQNALFPYIPSGLYLVSTNRLESLALSALTCFPFLVSPCPTTCSLLFFCLLLPFPPFAFSFDCVSPFSPPYQVFFECGQPVLLYLLSVCFRGPPIKISSIPAFYFSPVPPPQNRVSSS